MTDDPRRSPAVSIVIPTRNRWALLEQTIASVSRQSFAGVEAIVVDDASDDPPPAWLDAQPDALRVIRLGTRSERSAARNRGLEAARGELVLFLDDDDLLRPDAIDTMVRGLREHPRCVAAIGAYVVFDETGSRRRPRHPRRTIERDAWRDVLFQFDAFGSRILFRSAAVREAGAYRAGLSLSEDWDLLLRVCRLGPLLFVPSVVTEYRQHAGQTALSGVQELQDDLAAQHLSTLPSADQAVGRRIRSARARYREGDRALTDVDGSAALRHFVSVVRTYPGVLTSPVHRMESVKRIGKAAVALVGGRTMTRAVRRAKATVRRIAGRDVSSVDDAGT
jgi:hypothetical protein